MKPQIKLEFVTSAKESKRLHGILAIPRISRNGNLYLPEELARADSKTIPVLWNHQGSPKDAGQQISQSDIIGTMRLSWDPDLMQLKYEAEVDKELPKIPLHTSLGAFFEKQDHICGSSKCYAVPRRLQFVEEIESLKSGANSLFLFSQSCFSWHTMKLLDSAKLHLDHLPTCRRTRSSTPRARRQTARSFRKEVKLLVIGTFFGVAGILAVYLIT